MDIKKYEAMAKLELQEEERAQLLEKCEVLVQSFDRLADVDTNGVVPMVTPLNVQNILREDVTIKTIQREELLENAPEQYDGYFQVPRTLE